MNEDPCSNMTGPFPDANINLSLKVKNLSAGTVSCRCHRKANDIVAYEINKAITQRELFIAVRKIWCLLQINYQMLDQSVLRFVIGNDAALVNYVGMYHKFLL
jgi:hypothetical protein